jgi:myo-inositol 2-dehydrogenase / D-chiro-inositol 1-dehydrogenase
MRFGLLGAGRIGQIHGHNVAGMNGISLAAVTDAMPGVAQKLAAETGAMVMPTDSILNDPTIDAVLICTPTDTHADLIEQAMDAGKAVFCEKPVDLSSERIMVCLNHIKKANKPLMIGFNRRFDPNFAGLKSRLDAGQAGSIELVSIISRDPNPPPVDYVKRSGGLFRDMMIHDLDMARFITGEEITEVHAVGSSLVNPEIGQAGDVDTAAVLLKTTNGILIQISNSRRASYGYDQRIEVHGSLGMLRAGNQHESTIEFAGTTGFLIDPVQNFFLERYAQAYRLEIEAFVSAVKNGDQPSPSGLDGLKAQRLADAATQSAQTGQTVRL